MSRSFKRTPIVGQMFAYSDKSFKRHSAKCFRKACKLALKLGKTPENNRHAFANVYHSPKDGKCYLDIKRSPHLVIYMRK